MHHCSRCGSPTNVTIMSKFNEDVLCLLCKQDEKEAPGYQPANEAEVNACKAGDYNFHGVGLSDADRAFLDARVAARLKELKLPEESGEH
jgi:hypothetical protein